MEEQQLEEKLVKKVKCRFCGKEVSEDKIIYGITKTAIICEDCLDICNHIVEDRQETENVTMDNILKPMELKEKLDEYVIGQDEAKKIISVAVYNHYKRIFKLKDSCVQKTNICLIGSSGSGKTLLAKTVARLLDVPIVIADATTFTQAGYAGRNVEDCLATLVKKADGDISRAERGIVFIDEIDKIACSYRDNSTRDVGGQGVQQAFLKMIEGTTVFLPNEKENMVGQEEQKTIDTTNILFIVSGAFSGIEKIINSKNEKHEIGFGATSVKAKKDDEAIEKVTQDDLIAYGMIPEFVGRIQTIAVLHKLKENDLIRVLKEPKDALTKQYQQLMKVDGINLTFEDDSIRKIAKLAMKQKTGARSLKSILENTMMDIMYKAPSSDKKEITIQEKDIKAENV